ncbi:MAG: YceI family protein [Candidatus Promineifilaceae bacterium]
MFRYSLIFLAIMSLVGCGLGPVPVDPLALPSNLPSGVRLFVVEGQESMVGYEVVEEFLPQAETVIGRKMAERIKTTRAATSDIEGYIAVDFSAETPTLHAAVFAVHLPTLKSNRHERDQMIRAHWLQSGDFPQATFIASEMSDFYMVENGLTASFTLSGELTIRDVTVPIRLETIAKVEGDRLIGTASAELMMTDFGFNPPKILTAVVVENAFTLWVELTAVEQ